MPINPSPPAVWTADRRSSGDAGVTLIELMLVVSILAIVSAMAVPSVLAGLDGARASAAARYFAARARLTRTEAVKRAAKVALVFDEDGATYTYTCYLDTNGNGLRRAEIGRGIDVRICPPERLEDQFPGATFGIAAGVRPVGSGGTLAAGSDPVRLGRSDILTFSPTGTATPGTVYIRGRTNRQFAVRILGATGRTRVLEFNAGTGRWFER